MPTEHGSVDPDDVARVWKLMDKIHVCMLVSRDGEKIRARPMGHIARRDEHAIYLLTSVDSHKDEEIEADDHVCLTFAEPDDGRYLVVTGRARILDNRDLIRDLWSTPAEAYWSGPDDPRVRVIAVTPEDAQFWEGPHGLVAGVQMVLAAATAAPPVLGDQRKVDLN